MIGSNKSGKKNSEVCMNVSETDTFTSNVIGETCKINHKPSCGKDCLICLLSSKCCGKQYIEETTEKYRFRWNNSKDNDRKHAHSESCMREHLFKHFNSVDTLVSLTSFNSTYC